MSRDHQHIDSTAAEGSSSEIGGHATEPCRGSLISSEVHAIRTQTDQAKLILADAILKLGDSFEALVMIGKSLLNLDDQAVNKLSASIKTALRDGQV